jgi:non-canonical purine NTP pyrophosphatase (RdgB/HAM1 family)
MNLIFATTNQNKIREAESILGVKISGLGLDVDEVQSLDPKEVAIKKGRAYFEKIKKPVFVEDTSLKLQALKDLPGPYIDSFMSTLGNEGILELLKGKNNKAIAEVHIVYVDSECEYVFKGRTTGTIAKSPIGDNGFGWDPIFIPGKQKKTFAQMELKEKNKYSPRRKAIKKFRLWLDKNKEL